jgi:LysM repeat protein
LVARLTQWLVVAPVLGVLFGGALALGTQAAVSLALTSLALAQANPDPASPADSTITLTKTVEVYTFEDLTFSIDAHTVAPGENLAGILKKRGLWPTTPDANREAQLIRLVKRLNPVIANPDLIAPGQEIYLPTPRPVEEEPVPEPEPPAPEPEVEVDPPGVVSYSINDQAATPAPPPKLESPPASDQGPEPIPLESHPLEGEPLAAGEYPTRSTRPTRAPARSTPQAAGTGELEMAPDGTVFRTVTVKKGDTLEKLLRREGVDPNLIYRHLIKITLSLNPELKNPNVIGVGAELRVPAVGAYLAELPVSARVANRRQRAGEREANLDQASLSQAAAGAGSYRANIADKPKRKAPARPAGPKFTLSTKRLPPAPMPTASSQSSRTILGVIFTRLGETFVNKGRLFLPLDEPPHFDIDTGSIPVIELRNGRRIVLDLQKALAPELITRFRAKYSEYLIFQPARGESMEKALERLWPMCGYYRVYNKSQSFEGGTDIKLRLSADWLIWPTAETWNRGQPAVINLAPAPDNATPQAWVRFLANHGITVIDLYKGLALADSTRAPTPINNFTVIDVDSQNPSVFAETLIKSLGFAPRLGVRVDLKRGRIVTGGATTGPDQSPPVFWEAGPARTVLEYGDLSSEDLEVLRKNNFKVISSGRDIDQVLKSVLAALGIKLESSLVLNGSSPGGPTITLTISGQSFVFNGRSYLFTDVDVPTNMVALDPNQVTVVLKRQRAAANPQASASPAPVDPATLSPASPDPVSTDSPVPQPGPIEVDDLK